jgi:hypothetical protein
MKTAHSGYFQTLGIALLSLCAAQAQEPSNAHWGAQGDASWASIPQSLIENINTLPEQPKVNGTSFGVGLVRFHASGSPSYALQFSQLDADINGKRQSGTILQEITGAGTVRGFMATKYLNVVTRRHWSGGFALGGGVGKLDASYTRFQTFQGTRRLVEANSYDYVVPLFEILGRVDVRPFRFLSIGPYYGIRNGTLVAGGAVRFHFVR